MKRFLGKIKRFVLKNLHRPTIFKTINIGKERFICPLCDYHGPFKDYKDEIFFVKHQDCPKCGGAQRHRLQYLVLNQLLDIFDFSKMSILHCAPEPILRNHFRRMFKEYISTDLIKMGVDVIADLRNLPFKDRRFDVIFASHVLEHIKEDYEAIAEIRRVLKLNGFAILPVPIVGYETVEYSEPNSFEFGHIRSPGPDYFERYGGFFSKVDIYRSTDFPNTYQTYVYEDRRNWPKTMPLRPVMDGVKHIDFVPICYV